MKWPTSGIPGVLTIAEESTAWPAVSRPTYLGGLGFSLKWNMGWMNDTLQLLRAGSDPPQISPRPLTFSMIYAFTENFVLPLSHDEVVHGKGSLLEQDAGRSVAEVRQLAAAVCVHVRASRQEAAVHGRRVRPASRMESRARSLEWDLLQYRTHRGLQRLVADLNALYRREPALHEVDFDWQGLRVDRLQRRGRQRAVVHSRRAKDPQDFMVIVANFTPWLAREYRVGVPDAGLVSRTLQQRRGIYGGSNFGNAGGVMAEPVPWMGMNYSLPLRLPPLATLYFKRQ